MKKRIKKGFTLVELLVVIAILGILATVSVVGYSSFTKKANDSAAQQELTQINTYLYAADIGNDDFAITNDGIVVESTARVVVGETEAEVNASNVATYLFSLVEENSFTGELTATVDTDATKVTVTSLTYTLTNGGTYTLTYKA